MPNRRAARFFKRLDFHRFSRGPSFALNARIQLSFLFLMALAAGGGWLDLHYTQKVRKNSELIIHAHHMISQGRLVSSVVTAAETGVRSFVVAGNPEFLEPYEAAIQKIEAEMAQLESLAQYDALQSARVRDLAATVKATFAHLKRLLETAKQSDLEGAARMVRTGEGKQFMDLALMQIQEIESHEQDLLLARTRSARKSSSAALILESSVTISSVLLLSAVYFFVARFDRLRESVARASSAAEDRFRNALSSIGDAVIVTDDQGRLTFCNPACQAVLSVGNEKLGTPLTDILQFIDESASSSRESILDRAQKEGGVHRTNGAATIRLADGRVLPVDGTAAPLGGHSKVSQGSIIVLRDTREQRERDQALARGVMRFQSLVAASSQIVWTTEASGRTREDSPSWRAATGQSYEEWVGDGWLRAVHPEDQEHVRTAWKEAVAKQQPYYGEFRLRLADGAYLWTATRAVPVIDEDGTVREWVAMNYDIQLRKQAEQAQREAVQRNSEFVALLAHELRNPLAPLRNGLELLKQGGPEHAPQAFEFIERQIKHMTRLIDDLLDISRISQGKLELRVQRIDLREPMRHAADQALPAILAKRQRLFVSLPPTPAWIDGDYDRLMQVVTNLLNNAHKYSGEGASIWLTVEREGAEFKISVHDTGQGIPVGMRSRIWDMFMQGGGRSERVEGGLGIGLTLVKRLVALHKGSVQVHSEGPGTGSEFQVRLPAAASGSAARKPADKPVATSSEPLRILVIDDNEDSAVSLSMLLRVGGHDVRTALSGAQGLSEFASFRPQLVFCDIGMPRMNGHDVGQEIRSMPNGKATLLVALTGFGTSLDREASARAGFDFHMVKPIDAEGLANAIQHAAQRQAKV